jgi:hypothetical protein
MIIEGVMMFNVIPINVPYSSDGIINIATLYSMLTVFLVGCLSLKFNKNDIKAPENVNNFEMGTASCV